ncbi:MAG: 3-oxoacyl-[acyl-carrier-protein] reductase [Candidatus Omnitrophota bacterium]
MLLAGRSAIVTGASRGIGKAIAMRFAQNGADIAFNYLRSKDEAVELKENIENMGRRALMFNRDISDHDGIRAMVEDVKKHFGRLDIIVNNAGIVRDKALMLMEKKDWDDVIDTNLSGVFNLARASIVTFMKQKHGNILNITSVAGITGMPRQVNYSSGKAGIIGFTKSLAKEVASYNIRVNALAPGFIETDMTGGIKDKLRQEYLGAIPLGRFGAIDEVAETALFLVSDKSSYITGQVITVDGGLTM